MKFCSYELFTQLNNDDTFLWLFLSQLTAAGCLPLCIVDSANGWNPGMFLANSSYTDICCCVTLPTYRNRTLELIFFNITGRFSNRTKINKLAYLSASAIVLATAEHPLDSSFPWQTDLLVIFFKNGVRIWVSSLSLLLTAYKWFLPSYLKMPLFMFVSPQVVLYKITFLLLLFLLSFPPPVLGLLYINKKLMNILQTFNFKSISMMWSFHVLFS